MLLLGVGGFIYAANNDVANEFSFQAILPSFDTGVAFLPALVFNLMGFELVATMTKQMKDVKQMPKVVFLAIAITSFLYVAGTIGILMALPVDEIGLVAGIVDTLKVLFSEGPLGQFIIYALGVVTLITFIGNTVSWTMGSSRAAAEAGKEGELPQIAAKTSDKHGTPVGANLIKGLVSTSLIIIYTFFANINDELFWSMFASSSCVFFMPYLFMFPAYLKLRTADADRTLPFRIPGNLMVQKVITAVCFLIIFKSVVLFIFPDIIFGNIDWTYSLSILTGVLIIIAVGEILLMHANKRNNIKTTGEIA